MTPVRPGIWISDVVRALGAARTDSERAQVAQLLGFDLAAGAYDDALPPPVQPPLPDVTFSQALEEPDLHSGDEPAAWTAPEEWSEPTDVLAELPLLRPVQVEPTGARQEPLEPLARPTSERVVLPHLPLLVPHWTSAIIRALLARQVCEGPVDIPVLIDTLAHGRPVTALPRQPVPTLRYGVQVLVDRGTGMQPFRRDQDELVARIRAVVGPALVEVGYFSDVPQRGTGPGARWTRTTYQPPKNGRRILLLSDLGLGGPAEHFHRGTREEWEDFVGLVRQAGSSAVALSPYPTIRWARWMPRLLPLISWDRTTRPSRVGEGLP
ncbi:hypothetical protein [Actinacidiphila glaucinigra]|uniref:hypothetical protein n=1 Tax=Actinacidiphila glaucinigra TaxID=235986 RepID=UPI0035E1F970